MKRIIATGSVAALALVGFAGTASAEPPARDGKCVAANLSGLSGADKAAVAKSGPGALAGVIQLHLDGELDLLGVCGD
jgi:hypothetical protein